MVEPKRRPTVQPHRKPAGLFAALATFFRDMRLLGRQIAGLRAELEEHRRETRLMLGALALPDRALWLSKPEMVAGAPASSAFPASVVCRQESFDAPYFAYWTARLGEGLRYHRKLWEFVFLCQAFWERGVLREGARGLGFGVGTEPLSAYFASQECRIVATDMNVEDALRSGWTDERQHAAGREALRRTAICADSLFDRNVMFRECDMNHIHEDLVDFDFCWSACALEHLGSIEKGLAFIENSVRCLKPRGWAIHTTEFNLSSDEGTVDHFGTVLFRKQDMVALAARLRADGHHVAEFDFDPGSLPIDDYIDLPPYRDHPHLKMALMGYATTSIGIIIQRGRHGCDPEV